MTADRDRSMRSVGEVIVDREQLQARVAELGTEITRDYAGGELFGASRSSATGAGKKLPCSMPATSS